MSVVQELKEIQSEINRLKIETAKLVDAFLGTAMLCYTTILHGQHINNSDLLDVDVIVTRSKDNTFLYSDTKEELESLFERLKIENYYITEPWKKIEWKNVN